MIQKIEDREIDPLGVLLNLLEKKQLEISNFSLAQVADQYLHYLNDFKDQNKILENISEFLWVASKLALLKSKLLLASFQIEEIIKDEDEDGEELRNRLIEYQKFREISSEVKIYLEGSRELLTRKNREFVSKNLKIQFNKKDLEVAFKQAVNNFNFENRSLYQKKELIDVVKIKEKIEQVKQILDKVGTIKFSKIVFDETDRLEIVVSFLAILELVKQGAINIKQKDSFQEIEVSY